MRLMNDGVTNYRSLNLFLWVILRNDMINYYWILIILDNS